MNYDEGFSTPVTERNSQPKIPPKIERAASLGLPFLDITNTGGQGSKFRLLPRNEHFNQSNSPFSTPEVSVRIPEARVITINPQDRNNKVAKAFVNDGSLDLTKFTGYNTNFLNQRPFSEENPNIFDAMKNEFVCKTIGEKRSISEISGSCEEKDPKRSKTESGELNSSFRRLNI